MISVSGSFRGSIRAQSAIVLPDQPNHSVSIAEITGIQKSSDENWNNATCTYWAIAEIAGNSGTQRGYYSNEHGAAGREYGDYEGKISIVNGQVIVEGTWACTRGTEKFHGLSARGTFRTRLASPTEVEVSWEGTYELAAKAQAG
ncbi:MAG: hypothetical protein DMG32_08280 [Acidobacteria bacterium]|nr:MAG: hypothetical protein DMG32_08280 [Acidobacteriota bacterium]